MPAVVPFIPLIVGGIGAGTAIAGAKMQSNANRDATRMQSDAANNALRVQEEASRRAEQTQREQQAYERFQYDAAQRARAPYIEFKNRGLSKLADMVGLPGGGPQLGSPLTSRGPAVVNPMNRPAFTGGAPTAPGQQADMVTLQAPTGETRQVPRSMVQPYLAAGARVING